jgi:hypothetical protein
MGSFQDANAILELPSGKSMNLERLEKDVVVNAILLPGVTIPLDKTVEGK